MSKEATKKFVENNGFICNKCGKIIVDGHKHKNEEDLCDQCKIADLEAKLAESEEEIKQYENAMVLDYTTRKWRKIGDIQQENEQLKQQLSEKEKEIEKITKIVAYRDDIDRSTVINGVKFSDEQIITLQNIDYFADKHNQDKISFAVERLEKVKEYIKVSLSNGSDDDWDFALSTIDKQLDNQIKQLKEGK